MLQGSGLGGTSLINANVGIDMEDAVFEDSEWPRALRNDRKDLFKLDRKHFFDMIKPMPYPDDYPPLQKIDRMKESAASLDIENLPVRKLQLYVTFEDKIKNHVGVPQPKCTACGNCVSGCNVGSKNTLNMNYLPDAKAHGAELFTEVLSNRIIQELILVRVYLLCISITVTSETELFLDYKSFDNQSLITFIISLIVGSSPN